MFTNPKIIRYYRGSTGAARGGWMVKSVILDQDGKEIEGPVAGRNIATKKEANQIVDRMNEELGESEAL